MKKNINLLVSILLIFVISFIFVSCNGGGKVEEIKYTVTLYDGDTVISSTEVKGDSPLFTLPSEKKQNYVFVGWYKEANFVTLVEGDVTITQDTSFYVKWAGIFSITYNLNGGSGVEVGQYNETTPSFALQTPTKKDHIFAGWYTDENFSGDIVTEVVQGTTGDLVFYALFKNSIDLALDSLTLPLSVDTFQIVLPTKDNDNNVKFEWSTSNSNIITSEGVVLKDVLGGVTNTVTLTVKASKTGLTAQTKQFVVEVSPIGESVVTSSAVLPVIDLNDEYELSLEVSTLTAYYINNGHVPYVDIRQFLDSQEGFLYASEIDYAFVGSVLTLSFVAEGIDEDTSEEYSYTFILEIDYEANTLTVNYIEFFDYLIYSTETNFSLGLDVISVDEVEGHPVTFELNPYRFDAIYYVEDSKELVLLPEFLLSQLFCAPGYTHLYYNGEKFTSVYFLGNDNTKDFNAMRKSNLNKATQFGDVRVATLDSLVFALDYLYGLRLEKEYATAYDIIPTSNKRGILSLDPKSNLDFTASFIYKTLDEMHSSFEYGTVYGPISASYNLTSYSQLGTETNKWYANYDIVRAAYNNAKASLFANDFYKNYLADSSKTVNVVGNTAYILLNGFVTDTSEEASAFTDSYLFMIEAMKYITSLPAVENIVMDLSNNTGGNVGAMLRVLGFLTDAPLPYSSQNPLSGGAYTAYYQIDIDLDDNYDNDAYTEYNWYVLSSGVSFSAANSFANIAQQVGIPVIGQHTGGGASSISPVILADGTGIILSSNSVGSRVVDGEYVSVEHGIDVDYDFGVNSKYFNYAWITNFIQDLEN